MVALSGLPIGFDDAGRACRKHIRRGRGVPKARAPTHPRARPHSVALGATRNRVPSPDALRSS